MPQRRYYLASRRLTPAGGFQSLALLRSAESRARAHRSALAIAPPDVPGRCGPGSGALDLCRSKVRPLCSACSRRTRRARGVASEFRRTSGLSGEGGLHKMWTPRSPAQVDHNTTPWRVMPPRRFLRHRRPDVKAHVRTTCAAVAQNHVSGSSPILPRNSCSWSTEYRSPRIKTRAGSW